MFYVHRYLRLTIPIALIMAFIIAFLPPLVQSFNSQFAHMVALKQYEGCRKYGWRVLLYVNNFYDNGDACIGVTWYTCCDMIFFWISLLVIYPMWSNSKRGAVAWWSAWMVAATIPSIYQTWEFGLDINGGINAETDQKFINDYGKTPDFYTAPWIRFQPYLVGILLGYILHLTRGQEVKIDLKVYLLVWQAAFLAAFAVVYGFYGKSLNRAENIFYNGFQRIAWSASIGWVIFSCSKGTSGKIRIITQLN